MTGGQVLRRGRAAVDRLLAAGLASIARRSARDATATFSGQHVLVLAPHPDDETIGCGATIARTLSSGGRVTLLVASDGRFGDPDRPPEEMAATRRDELAGATVALGLAPGDVVSLDLVDGTLADHEDTLVAEIDALVRARDPTVVLAPSWRDPHPDHRSLGRAARRALAGRDVDLIEYIVWGWVQPTRLLDGALGPGHRTIRPAKGTRRPRFARPIMVTSGEHLATKRAALACHLSQLGPSAASLSLPAGSGFLDARFLSHFLGDAEIFFPVGRGGPGRERDGKA